ncbi:MAG: ATP-binding protein [Bacteroidales bacterium]|nr:ATP-binding protein [Bacteroidales bacterium]
MLKKPFKIAITGPESTGKSFLAKELAAHFNTIWVPEYAREYIGSLQRDYTAKDIEAIALEQVRREKELLRYSNRILFCDTDPLVCHIWHKVKYGTESKVINKLLHENKYNMILLCDIDLEWTYDPMREHPDKRDWLFQKYILELETMKNEYKMVSGHEKERIHNATSIIHKYLNFK